MKRWLAIIGLGLLLGAGEAPWTYVNDLEKAEPGTLPQDLMKFDCKIVVRSEGGNRFLEASPFPTATVGTLFGPDEATAAAARIRGEATGKRYPELGVSVGGPSGAKIWLMPAVKQVQIRLGDDVKASAPYEWKSGVWTQMQVQVTESGGKWKVEGKAWEEGQPEPAWLVSAELAVAPPKGKATVAGQPYSDKPIQFDDLRAR